MESFKSTLSAALLLAVITNPASAKPAPNRLDGKIDAFLSRLPLVPASADEVKARCDGALALAGEAKAALEARTGKATIAGDFAAYDSLILALDSGNDVYLVMQTNTSAPVRDAAQACSKRLSDFGTEVSLSRPIYDRLAAIPTTGLDTATRYTLQKQLTSYRLAGVNKDAATRASVTALQKQITDIALLFEKNIRDDKGDIALKPDELTGLPQDYLDAHKPGKDGLVHLTYDYPDVYPALTFASQRDTRRKVFIAFNNRGWPANEAVLKKLLEQRYELARLLGYSDFATLDLSDKMIGTPQHAAQFIDEVDAVATPGANADYAELQAFAKSRDPSIDRVLSYDASYYSNLLRKQKYAVDAAEVRRYFTYDKARTGIFKLVHDLFGADIRPWNTPVWDKSVSAWELYDGNKLVGRFYLDMHPRAGKYNHAAAFPVRTGVEGRQIPIGGLICNFPVSGPMDHKDVTSFLHEFGHLIHDMYSGHTRYATQSMGNLQWDFIETPSKFLEEWTWDYDTLKGFASDENGKPIPKELVDKMNTARTFGEGIDTKNSLTSSAISLNYYNRKPDFDLKTLYDAQISRYSIYPPVIEEHHYAAFGHLNAYSAHYYTYVWSKAIAFDLLTKFKAAGIRNPEVAMQYRKRVLEPGASQDANDLIRSFLGRPSNLEAYKRFLQRTPETGVH